VDAVQALLQDCIADMRQVGIDQWDEIYPGYGTLLTDIRTETLYLGFKHGATLAGALTLDEFQASEWSMTQWRISGGRIMVVHRVMVSPPHQGQGIGTNLMQFAETWGRAKGYDAIRLDAFSGNPRSLRFYRRLGYHDAGGVRFRKGILRCFEKRLTLDVG